MDRNTVSHFSEVPHIEIQRSVFDRSSEHKTTFNAGKLIPIYIDEVLPGDTFTFDQAVLSLIPETHRSRNRMPQ